MIMSTLMESFDFSGKTLCLFVTHAVSGLGSTERDYAALAPVPRSANVLRYVVKRCNQPSLKLRSGCARSASAPGSGRFQPPAEETRAAVGAALSTGYRQIDTAAADRNERQVGEAVHRSGLDRNEVFLETKI
jgi:hypothetical protein